MPMYDIKSFEDAGVPLTKNVIKYGIKLENQVNVLH